MRFASLWEYASGLDRLMAKFLCWLLFKPFLFCSNSFLWNELLYNLVVPVVLLTTFIIFCAPTKIEKIAQQFFTTQQFFCFHSALFLFILLHAIFLGERNCKKKIILCSCLSSPCCSCQTFATYSDGKVLEKNNWGTMKCCNKTLITVLYWCLLLLCLAIQYEENHLPLSWRRSKKSGYGIKSCFIDYSIT